MVRAMCGVKLMEKKRTEHLMEMLGHLGVMVIINSNDYLKR